MLAYCNSIAETSKQHTELLNTTSSFGVSISELYHMLLAVQDWKFVYLLACNQGMQLIYGFRGALF